MSDFFFDCMEKERRTKFCGVLYGERASHKVLWRFVWRKNVAQSFVAFCMEKEHLTKFCDVLIRFDKL